MTIFILLNTGNQQLIMKFKRLKDQDLLTDLLFQLFLFQKSLKVFKICNKGSAVAKMTARCCTSLIFAIEWGGAYFPRTVSK